MPGYLWLTVSSSHMVWFGSCFSWTSLCIPKQTSSMEKHMCHDFWPSSSLEFMVFQQKTQFYLSVDIFPFCENCLWIVLFDNLQRIYWLTYSNWESLNLHIWFASRPGTPCIVSTTSLPFKRWSFYVKLSKWKLRTSSLRRKRKQQLLAVISISIVPCGYG